MAASQKPKETPIKLMLVMESWGQGGTETYAAGLIKLLASRDIAVSLVLLREPRAVNLQGLSDEKISVTGFWGLLLKLLAERPDVLSLHLYTNLLETVLLGRLLSIPVITTLHMPYSAWGWRHRLYWRMAARFSGKVVGVSNKIIGEIKGKNVIEKPIPGGVDAVFFTAKRKGSKSFQIAAVGRLGKEKDWPTLIEAVRMLPSKNRQKAELHFYGDGSEAPLLKSLVRQGGLKAVFHGHVQKADLVNALSQSNLSVLPSRFEGLPLSLLECMAAGVPMIISNFLMEKDRVIQSGVNGHVFPIGDAKALSDLIAWHMANPAKSSRMGLAGRKFVSERFAEPKVFLPYLDIFRTAAKD